jgi:hypothetical protein
MEPFELLEDLRPGQRARAALLKWDGTKYIRSNERIDLHEFVGTHGDKGDRGYCFFSPHSKRWEAAAGLYEQVSGWLPT